MRRSADGGNLNRACKAKVPLLINPASFYSSGTSLRPQKMLKHLLLNSIIEDFFGALGVLNLSKDTLQVLVIAVALGRLELSIHSP